MVPLAHFSVLAIGITSLRAETVFYQPPGSPLGNYSENPVYNVGENIWVSWASTYLFNNLELKQTYPPLEKQQVFQPILSHSNNKSEFTWSFALDSYPVGVPKGGNAVFYFALYASQDNNIGPLGMSHYINISAPVKLTSDNTPSSFAANSHLSNGAVAGICIGVMITILLIVMAMVLFIRKRLRPQKQEETKKTKDEPDKGEDIEYELQGDNEMRTELYQPGLCPELCGNTEYLAELDGDSTVISPCSPPSYSLESTMFTPNTIGLSERLVFEEKRGI